MKAPTQQEINEWRENPVTMALRAALSRVVEDQQNAMTEAFWAGVDVPERERLHVVVRKEFIEDFFTLDEDDLRAAMEAYDERQRHGAD